MDKVSGDAVVRALRQLGIENVVGIQAVTISPRWVTVSRQVTPFKREIESWPITEPALAATAVPPCSDTEPDSMRRSFL